MNNCARPMRSPVAALRTISAEPYLSGQGASKYASSDDFNSAAILHCGGSQYLVLLVGWAARITTLELLVRLWPFLFPQIVVYLRYNLCSAVTTSSQ